MFEEVPSLSCLPFFSCSSDLKYLPHKKKTFFTKDYLLPSTAKYLGEAEFSRIYAAWNEEKLLFHIEVGVPFERVEKEFRKSDCVELFIDTRDIKSRRFMTQFCHHFVFYPEKYEGFYGKEVTKFRSDDIHPLCDPKELLVQSHIAKSEYVLDIEIPKNALYGFQPDDFQRLGFHYTINRSQDEPQNFAFSTLEFLPEQNPHLWSTLHLKKTDTP